jgi:hypothetical protein
MAKRFAGFTPEQMGKIIPEMQGMQSDEQAKFLASQPGAAARVGKMAELAQKRIGMAAGGMAKKRGYAPGGLTGAPPPTAFENDYSNPDTLAQYHADQAPGGIHYESASSQAAANTPNTTGGFDMGIDTPELIKQPGDFTGGPALPKPALPDPALPVEPEYDPSTGLPTAPEGLTEADYAPFLEQIAGGSTGAGAENNIPGITEMLSSGNVPQDPTDYEITGSSRDWTITYADGTTLKSPYKKRASIDNEAANIANVLQQYKESDPYKASAAAQEQYTQQLDQYKTYSAEQAQTAADTPVFETIDAAQGAVTTSQNLVSNYMKQLGDLPEDHPQRATLEGFIADEQVKLNQAKAGLTQAQQRAAQERNQKRVQATTEFEADPASQVTRADVATLSDAQKEAGMISEGTGQAGETTDATLTTATAEGDVKGPVVKDAVKAAVQTATPAVQDTVSKLVASTGKPTEGALADAATMTPQELASLGLTVDQIKEATQVIAPASRTIQEGELVSGSAVDFERAKAETNFTAATGVPSTEATVQGQLTGLLEQFEGGETPAWAAGAMRAATATLAARGLGASSMAGQAIVQAAMESAMPIAMADAQTRASFEAQNLSNRQQAAMFAAEQRSKFLGMEFDQEFQARVQNAARVADVANQNFNAEVQIAMENARLTQTVDIANLDARNAKIMADAAAMSQVDITNLNNRQQAAIQYANSFLQMDMANLTNEQQATMFKSQSIVQALFSDQAAENAAAQFNATSENQTNQFYDSLTSQVDQFNADQGNAMERFNAGEANALAQFNKQQEDRRAEFNAQQSLVVEQANAKWAQDIATTETAAINEANRDEARAANEMSAAAYEAQIQMERDTMSYAFQTANNNADRATQIAIQTMVTEASASEASAKKSSAFAAAIGTVAAEIIGG